MSSCAPSLPMPSTIQPEPSAGAFRIGQLQLAAVDARRAAGSRSRRSRRSIGELAQPADGRLGVGFAGQIGQRDEEMRLQLQRAQARHQRSVSDTACRARRLRSLPSMRGQARRRSGCRKARRASPAGGGRSRAGNRKGRRLPTRDPDCGRLRGQQGRRGAAGRRRPPRPADLANARAVARGACRETQAPGGSSTTRLRRRVFAAAFALISAPCVGKLMMTDRPGIGVARDQAGRRGTSSPPWRG